jgi:L-ornithine N5-monooxygenase
MASQAYDLIGIGFGPANIAVAIALEELGYSGSALFLESRTGPAWQPGMLLPGADIQNHPLRDLVTPRNPTSRFSFTNFLHTQGRLLAYLNLGTVFALRKDYAQYVAWAASEFKSRSRYGVHVTDVEPEENGRWWRIGTSDRRDYAARAIILAPGRTPYIPTAFSGLLGPRVFHLNDYLPRVEALTEPRRICVIGGSQSAVEIVLDLAQRFPRAHIVNIMRGFGYQLKDTSPFTCEVYFPNFIDYFYAASQDSKLALTKNLNRTNYSSADRDVIDRLYLTVYEQSLEGPPRVEIMANREVVDARDGGRRVVLATREVHEGRTAAVDADAVVLATGFRNLGDGPQDEKLPPLLAPLVDRLAVDRRGVLHVSRDYSLRPRRRDVMLPPIFLNGLCESSHGLGDAGSFSLLSLRAATICQTVLNNLKKGASPARPTVELEPADECAPAA